MCHLASQPTRKKAHALGHETHHVHDYANHICKHKSTGSVALQLFILRAFPVKLTTDVNVILTTILGHFIDKFADKYFKCLSAAGEPIPDSAHNLFPDGSSHPAARQGKGVF